MNFTYFFNSGGHLWFPSSGAVAELNFKLKRSFSPEQLPVLPGQFFRAGQLIILLAPKDDNLAWQKFDCVFNQ